MAVVEVLKKQLGLEHQAEQDGACLRLFVQQHDGDAFARIVQRHAAMVHAVCRRVLGNVADAEDASQAAFLILAQRAHTIRKQNDVAGWLFGVARRVALQALRQRQRREAREKRAAVSNNGAANDLLVAQEAALLCDAELFKLPLRYRQALVLCCIEGLPKSLAARRLGWPEGTVASCVSRGKKLLAERLIRRGVLPVLAAAVLSTPVVQAIPLSLSNLSASALALVKGRSLVNLALPGAIQLVNEVSSTMLQRRWFYLVCSACLVLSGPGLLLGWHLASATPAVASGESPATQQVNGKKPTPVPNRKLPENDQERLQGQWKLVAVVNNRPAPTSSRFNETLGSMIELKKDSYAQLGIDGKSNDFFKLTYRINELVQPKELDILDMNGSAKPCLYAIDTDTLVICSASNVNSRPVEISAARDGSTSIAVYRRVPTPGMASAEEIRLAEEMIITKVGRSLQVCCVAMHNYQADYKRLPAPAIFDKTTGKPLLSWRVLLLPYLGYDNLRKQFHQDEPWDSEHNKKLIPEMPAIFAHPATGSGSEFKTHYRAFVAPAKLSAGNKNLYVPCLSLDPAEKRTLQQLTMQDGTSNTMAIVEANEAVVWTKPDEIVIEHDEAPIPSLGAIPNRDYFVAVHFDGSYHLFKQLPMRSAAAATNEWYYKLLRQVIGWKDGMSYDVAPLMLR